MPGRLIAMPEPSMPEAQASLAQQVLDALATNDTIASDLQFPKTTQADLRVALDLLRSKCMVGYEQLIQSYAVLEEEGQAICATASPEYIVWRALQDKGQIGIKELATVVGGYTAKHGIRFALKLAWIRKEGSCLFISKPKIEDTTKQQLEGIRDSTAILDAETLHELRKRKLVRHERTISYTITKGTNYSTKLPLHNGLTAELLVSAAWQFAKFKPYNFSGLALGTTLRPGALHPLNRMQDEFRQILFTHGFFELPSKRYIEDETQCLVLRTRMIAANSWCLHYLSKDPLPAQYFSIDRVFQGESIDATHLAEFHQVEGVIADFELTIGGLMEFLSNSFEELGIKNLRFKPAYDPDTAPSIAIFGHHIGLGKWIKIGKAGRFRPEVLLPMGIPETLRVYSFSWSLESVMMVKYNISDIRTMVGHKVDLQSLAELPVVRMAKG